MWCSNSFDHPPNPRLHPGYHRIYEIHFQKACEPQEIKIFYVDFTKKKGKKPSKHPSRDRVKQRINPTSTGVLLQEQHPKEISKNSSEDEEVQKMEILCGVAIHLTILPIPACTPDILVFMRSISRKLVDCKEKNFFYVDFKKKKLKNL